MSAPRGMLPDAGLEGTAGQPPAHSDRDQDHGHRHDGGDHRAGHRRDGIRARLLHAVRPHSHDPSDSVDAALEANTDGIRAVRTSLVILLATSAVQAAVVLLSGSIALLADTIHNLSDALTALPLWLAFHLARRPPTRRYTYGLGRVEDLAGLAVVAMIGLSAVVAGWESIRRLADPQPVGHLGIVVLAGLVGFAGNQLVAVYRIRVGRRIGSAALVADGRHASADAITSLGVVVGAIGVAAGWPIADPLVGLMITAAILVVLVSALRDVGRRLLDGVDPALVDRAHEALAGVPGVRGVEELRLRWLGHRLRAEAIVGVDHALDVRAGHDIAVAAAAALRAALPQLEQVGVHVEPAGP
jgi:cation diffusion facilitator family transporter